MQSLDRGALNEQPPAHHVSDQLALADELADTLRRQSAKQNGGLVAAKHAVSA